jgi:hypothetical protein
LIEGTKNHVKCNFCSFVSRGGITRQKHYLASDSPDVTKCTKVPAQVKALFKEEFEKKKLAKELLNKRPHFDDDVIDLEEDEDEEEITQSKGE